MKKLLLYLALLFASACPPLLGGQEAVKAIKLDKSVPLPPQAEVLKNQTSDAAQLKTLLTQGKLREFYQQAKPLFEAMDSVKDKDFTPEEFSNRLWVYYYYTAAPTLPTEDYNDLEWTASHSNIDLNVKNSLGRFIGRHTPQVLAKHLPYRKQEVSELLASYYADIMRTLRDNYNPWIRTQEKQIREEKSTAKITPEETLLWNNRLSFLYVRNRVAGMNLLLHEKSFIKFLMKSFPGKANIIKKYITQAGYGDDEFVELIELTAGRNPQTQFLLKGTRSRNKQKDNEDKPQDIPRTIAL